MKLMPAPLTLLDPSTVSVHLELESSVKSRSSLSAYGVTFGAKSAMKSANTCDLRAVRGWKVISYSLSSTVHLVSLSESSGLCSMLFNG